MAIAEKKRRRVSPNRRSKERIAALEEEYAQWKIEFAKRQAERDAEAEQRRAEAEQRRAEAEQRRAEAEQQLLQWQAETNKRMSAFDKAMGKLGNRLGEWVQCTLIPNLPEKFKAFEYTFSRISPNVFFNDAKFDIAIEMDGFMQNDEICIAVEAKLKPSVDDITIFTRRLAELRRFMGIHRDQRKLYGTIAGMVVLDKSVREYALSKGFYLVEPSGEDVMITVASSGPTEY